MADSKEMIMATGRRKCAVAVVKLVKGKGRIFVNGKTLQAYIGNMPAVEMMVYRPLVLTENQEKYDVRVKAVGGGIVAQAAAITGFDNLVKYRFADVVTTKVQDGFTITPIEFSSISEEIFANHGIMILYEIGELKISNLN